MKSVIYPSKKNREQVFGLSETTGAVKYLVY